MDATQWIQIGLLLLSVVANICQKLKKRELERATQAIIKGVEAYAATGNRPETGDGKAVKDFVQFEAEGSGVNAAVHKLVKKATEPDGS